MSEERAQLLAGSSHEFNPVDYAASDERKRRRSRLCATATVVCCVGVALCLAIALPLTINRGGQAVDHQGASVRATDGGGQRNNLMMMALSNDIERITHNPINRHTKPVKQTTEEQDVSTTPLATKSHHSTKTVSPTKPSSSSMSSATAESTSTTASPFLPSCPRVPKSSLRSGVNMSLVNGTTWFELHRIQTFNAPSFAPFVACATMELMIEEANSTRAEMLLRWKQGIPFFNVRRNKIIELSRHEATSDTWIAHFNNTDMEPEKGQVSFLVLLNNYLLVYECFPDVPFTLTPGYIIRVYSNASSPDVSRIDEALLLVAQIWGLNPGDFYPQRIRQLFCDLDVGRA